MTAKLFHQAFLVDVVNQILLDDQRRGIRHLLRFLLMTWHPHGRYRQEVEAAVQVAHGLRRLPASRIDDSRHPRLTIETTFSI